MKIDSLSNRPVVSTTNRANARPANEGVASPAAAGDAVELSSTSADLSAGGAPSVNAARVMEIKLAITEGRFQINPSAIADRLLTSARELIQNHRPA